MSLRLRNGFGDASAEPLRMGMQAAGNNIANANTVGYSRQRVELSASLPY
ncbi:MAG: flagellar basal body protein [Candidatus Nanopelagicales bacterium]